MYSDLQNEILSASYYFLITGIALYSMGNCFGSPTDENVDSSNSSNKKGKKGTKNGDKKKPLLGGKSSKSKNLPKQVGSETQEHRISNFSTLNAQSVTGLSDQRLAQKKTSIKDYKIMRVLGKGAFGTVYLVRHKESGGLMAMKTLSKADLIKKNQMDNTKAEKEILSKIRSPFIVNLFSAFQTKQKLYLVLEYMAGGELFFHLKKSRTFDEERVRFYAAQVLLGIESLHKQGIIYRDLKPENVLMDLTGNLKIADFGLSKKANKADTFCGTPEYLAPELLKGELHDRSVDWWSLVSDFFWLLYYAFYFYQYWFQYY